MRIPRLVKWVGYPLFGLVVFVVGFVYTFPYDRLKGRVEGFVNAGSPRLDVKIGSMGPSFLLGVEARDVVVRVLPDPNAPIPLSTTAAPMGAAGAGAEAGGGDAAAPADDEDGKPKVTRLVLDRLSIHPGIFALIAGNVDVDFALEGLGGAVEGSYSAEKKEGWKLELEAEGLDLGKVPLVAEAVGIPVGGELSTKVKLSVPKGMLGQATGSVELSCDNCTVGDGKHKLKVPGNPMLAAGITVPKVRLGKVGGSIDIDKGAAELKDWSSKSPDIELALDGGFNLRQPVGFSTARAYLKFKLSADLKKRHAMFSLVEDGLGNARRQDGFFGVLLTGTLRKLRPVPSKMGLGKGGPAGRPPRGGAPGFGSR